MRSASCYMRRGARSGRGLGGAVWHEQGIDRKGEDRGRVTHVSLELLLPAHLPSLPLVVIRLASTRPRGQETKPQGSVSRKFPRSLKPGNPPKATRDDVQTQTVRDFKRTCAATASVLLGDLGLPLLVVNGAQVGHVVVVHLPRQLPRHATPHKNKKEAHVKQASRRGSHGRSYAHGLSCQRCRWVSDRRVRVGGHRPG